jgi:hypothetical protein
VAKRNDKLKLTKYRDPITDKVLTQQPNYPAGKGIVHANDKGTSIAAKIEREQRRQENGSK